MAPNAGAAEFTCNENISVPLQATPPSITPEVPGDISGKVNTEGGSLC